MGNLRSYLLAAICIASALQLRAAESLHRREWIIDGLAREAFVYVSPQAASQPSPVVFAFHGHGGNMRGAARIFHIHDLWPEAIVVYPQGVNTPGLLTDPEGKRPGWQHAPGDHADRDLKLFDAMLKSMKTDYLVDEKRIYATGHSNGGSFTYVLWEARGDVFAAVAPLASIARRPEKLSPKPVLHLAGENDRLVKYAWQQETFEALKKLNKTGEGQPWEKWCVRYSSSIAAPLVTLVHPGGHEVPPEAPAIVVKFFREQTKP